MVLAMLRNAMLLLVPLWPGLLALTSLALHGRRLGGLLAVAGTAPALLVALNAGAYREETYPWLLFGTRLGLDRADAVFLSFAAIVWILASVYALGTIRRESGRERFFGLFLLTMSGNLGALVAQDMPSFYAFYALMSFAAFGIIVHELTREARHAAKIYIVLVVIGEAALAAGMIIAAGATGSSDFLAVRAGLEAVPLRHFVIALAFVGFGIKAGGLVLPVLRPLAHPVAPAAASAVLSGTIIVTGLVGWLRILPVGEWALPGWGAACIGLGLAAAFYGAIVGMDQRRPKVVLAYSSISQMGIMTAGVGMLLMEPALAPALRVAIAFFALHHGLAKCSLFLGAGLANSVVHARARRWLVTGLALPSLALAGAPFTSGMVVKSAIVAAEAQLPPPWASALFYLLPLTSVATALLMARFLVLVRGLPAGTRPRASAGPWLAWCASLALVLLLPLWLAPTVGYAWAPPTFVDSAWPLGLALAVALVAIGLWRRAGRPALPEIPAGDLLLPVERLMLRAQRALAATAASVRPLGERVKRAGAAGRRRAWALIEVSGSAEALLDRWRTALLLALVLGAVLALLAR